MVTGVPRGLSGAYLNPTLSQKVQAPIYHIHNLHRPPKAPQGERISSTDGFKDHGDLRGRVRDLGIEVWA